MENNTPPASQPATPTPSTPPVADTSGTPPIQPTPPPVAPTAPIQDATAHNGHHISKIIAFVLIAVNVLLALYIIVMLQGR